jgi:poly-gamma-glutamate capsule biosynthesis protein CapA/YwtB (metallophosphatase superfamily)
MSKKEIHYANGTSEIVDLTAEEITTQEQSKIKFQAEKQAIETAKQAKENAKVSGNQKLLDLGLSQAEATALTGYTPPVE